MLSLCNLKVFSNDLEEDILPKQAGISKSGCHLSRRKFHLNVITVEP